MEQRIVDLHGISNEFYDDYYKDIYQNDKQNLLNFSQWVGNSIIFAHNAPFDMNIINNELLFWGLKEIPIIRYRCSMRIFREIISKIDPLYDEKYTSLEKCCQYFGLKTNDKIFHNALFDTFMTARLVCKIYEKIDSDSVLYKDFDYNQDSLESHYLVYKKHKAENLKNKNLNYKSNNRNPSYIKIEKNIINDENINNEFVKENKNNKNIKEKAEDKEDKFVLSNDIIDEIFKELQ